MISGPRGYLDDRRKAGKPFPRLCEAVVDDTGGQAIAPAVLGEFSILIPILLAEGGSAGFARARAFSFLIL